MFKTLVDAFKNKDIRNKILLTLGLLLLFRIGAWLPIPGIDVSVFESSVNAEGQTFLQLLSGISGGALANGALLALGVSPYITASIVIQLLSMAIPSWERLAQQGEEGKKKIALYTKICALILAIAQAVGIVVSFSNSGAIIGGIFGSTWITATVVVCVLVAGAMFTLFLGEKITELGIANGLSLLIFVGILSSAGTALLDAFTTAFTTNVDMLWQIFAFFVALLLIFSLIVLMDLAERRVPIQYAKQIQGRRMRSAQNTFIPIRLMANGVLPIIFAMSLLSFPQIIMSIFWPTSEAAVWYANNLGAGSWVYSIIVGVLILFFSYFTNMMSFKPVDISKQIQSNGGFVQGIRPGRETAEYLSRINKRITFFGALFLAFLTIVPTLIFKAVGTTGLVNAFSATGMIIVVSVALEINKQLEAQLLMKNYKGFLK